MEFNLNQTINVCLASDEGYAKYLGMTIISILKSAALEDSFKFYVLDGGISTESKEKVESLKSIKDFAIEWLPLDMDFFSKFQKSRWSYVACARLLIPEFIKEDKVLYLDCDILVRTSLAPLFNTDIDSYYAAGVIDYCVKDRGWDKKLFKSDNDYNLYFNSGVLLINVKLWRQDGIHQKMIQKCLDISLSYKFLDQDVINLVLKGRIKSLDPRWNVMNYFYSTDLFLKEDIYKDLSEITSNPYIRHFKGWKKNNLFPQRDEYLKLMKDSPWSEYIEEDDPRWLLYLKVFFSYMWRHPLCFVLPRFYKRWYYRGFLGLIRS